MTSEQFGDMALQMLDAVNITGAQLDVAIAFREIARKVAAGEVTFVDRKAAGSAPDAAS